MKSALTFPHFRPDEFAALVKRAAADGHGVLFPTHLVKRNGETVGYLGVNSTPTLNVWLDTQKTGAADSIAVLERVEDFMRFSGRGAFAVPCSRTSPFFPHMARLGFRQILDGGVFLKENL